MIRGFSHHWRTIDRSRPFLGEHLRPSSLTCGSRKDHLKPGFTLHCSGWEGNRFRPKIAYLEKRSFAECLLLVRAGIPIMEYYIMMRTKSPGLAGRDRSHAPRDFRSRAGDSERCPGSPLFGLGRPERRVVAGWDRTGRPIRRAMRQFRSSWSDERELRLILTVSFFFELRTCRKRRADP